VTREQLQATLEGWLDFHPWPRTFSGDLQAQAASQRPVGFSGRVVCRACKGRGRLDNKRACHDCRGQGGWEYDPYVGKLFPGEGGPAPEARPRLRERESTGDATLDALAEQHERRDRTRAAGAIIQALSVLHPGTRALLLWTYVLAGQPPTAQAEQALDALAELVADVRAPGWVLAREETRKLTLAAAKGKRAARNVQAQRNASIRRERQEGASVQELAQRYGLDKSRISQITRAAA